MEFTTNEIHTLGIALVTLKQELEKNDGPLFRALAAMANRAAVQNGVKAPYVPTAEDCEALAKRLSEELDKA